MLNQTVLVGRLVKNPELKELESGKSVSNITLAVPRSYKNSEGEYDTDFVDITLWDGVATNTAGFCKKGDMIGVKGRVQTQEYEVDGKEIKKMVIIAEKVTFLSSRKENEKEI